MSHTYEYPRPMVTTDILVYNKRGNIFKILLIKRLNDPYKNCWALPGGFVDKDEALIVAAKRELFEETSVKNIELIQFKSYGNKDRDPRGHCISVVHYAVVRNEKLIAKAGDDAKQVKWFSLQELPKLAFDHEKIIHESLKELSIE